MNLLMLASGDARYPRQLQRRLGEEAPKQIAMLGNPDILTLAKTAFFCSARCPGSVILAAHDQAASWRDAGRCVIGGFHSPIEKECLEILLRGKQPIIICPARGIDGMRVPGNLKEPLAEHKLLVLSAFARSQIRLFVMVRETLGIMTIQDVGRRRYSARSRCVRPPERPQKAFTSLLDRCAIGTRRSRFPTARFTRSWMVTKKA